MACLCTLWKGDVRSTSLYTWRIMEGQVGPNISEPNRGGIKTNGIFDEHKCVSYEPLTAKTWLCTISILFQPCHSWSSTFQFYTSNNSVYH